MGRYLMTHSLLASWLYTMKENPYEDMTTERDPMGEFMQTLRREPTPTTEAMQNGIKFEDMVTDIINGRADPNDPWYAAAEKVARRCAGGVLQYKAKKIVEVGGMSLLLYGRLDCLKAGEIIDIKFTKSYDTGKFFSSTQHPTYFELIPEARQFTYIASNGRDVWPETYFREDAPSIFPVISDFFDWLRAVDLMQVYQGDAMNGKLKDWSFSRTGESVLTITTRESCKKLWDALGDQEITFSIKRRVIPRSLNANNYAWSLIEKLAVAVKSDKDSVYEEMLRRYGTGETYTDEAGNECKVLFSLREGVPPALVARHYAETGVGYVEGKKFIHYRAIKGTSEYSTKEMSVFLDGIISECQEVGIETDTPEQIARYKEAWHP